jgi:uncharacterized repeat protein (TIGR03943 family)
MLYAKIASGTLGYYINARFFWLPYVALLMLTALALTQVSSLYARRTESPVHTHTHSHALGTATIALLILPIVFGLLIPARPLGAAAVGTRSLTVIPGRAASDFGVSAIRGEKTMMDWLREFGATKDLSVFEGQTIDVTGFVFHDKRVATNQFWVARFVISCCVADASAVGILVQMDNAADLKPDTWVRVRGKLTQTTLKGEHTMMIVASAIDNTDVPTNPYLQP